MKWFKEHFGPIGELIAMFVFIAVVMGGFKLLSMLDAWVSK